MGTSHPDEDLGEMASTLIEVSAMLVRQLPNRQQVSLTTVSTLGRLDREGPQRLTALAAAEGVAQPSMTQLVHKLEAGGLVERRPDPQDKRGCLIEVTEAGRRILAERRRERRDWLAERLAALSERERGELDAAMRTALPIVRRAVRPADVFDK
ncbi:MarR family winged helix-turn-helix transcriptional regulator [Nocardia vaccinii]|uniref:MarR family winged helix-turn-helix transcriptional regulator n=1 Tax=Nocardia vaccinii TaxID=1822 RepID=UPI000A036B6C|nr:MarR family transcriptional regulator [Nocardia vaccinii]